jgi:phospholipid/cholesterol/gamma-HCH transport system substrate-binding protein
MGLYNFLNQARAISRNLQNKETGMPRIFTDEVKTGFVVVLCVVILIGLTIMAGNFKLFEETYSLDIIFSNVSGIEKDAPVRLSGFEVGKVSDVKLVYREQGDTVIRVSLELNKDTKIRQGSKASVTTLGLMGEKYIELTPGDKGAPFLEDNATLQGKDPVDIEAVIDEATSTMQVAREAMGNISSLVENLDNAIADNRPNIDVIMNNLRRTTDNLEEFTDDIKRNPWKLLVKGSDK